MKKGKFKFIFPIVHIILTFLWERIVFAPNEVSIIPFSIARNDSISLKNEQLMFYIIAKLMAIIFILFLWSVFFLFCSKKITKRQKTIFLSILVISSILTVIQWPENFMYGFDNPITYSYALRMVPEYWHSIYIGCIYAASMMVFPHAISVSLIQNFLFIFSICYLFFRAENNEFCEEKKIIKYLFFIPLLFRDTFMVSSNPERPEYNAVFLLLFLGITMWDIVEKRKRPIGQVCGIIIFSAFLTSFRTENIILSLPVIIVWLLFMYSKNIKKELAVFALFFVALFVFKTPSKVGETKYYGKDYSIINAFGPLRNIFNSTEANLTYDGCGDDLAAISKIVPCEYISEYGSEAYRRLNYSEGRIDFNQSLASIEDSDVFLHAYYSIVAHNVPIYLKTQWYYLLHSMECRIDDNDVDYLEGTNNLPEYGRELWEVGVEDTLKIPGRYFWYNNKVRISLLSICTWVRIMERAVFRKLKVYFLFVIAEMILGLCFAFNFFFSKKKEKIGIGIITLFLEGYFVALALVVPASANMYFHAFIYAMYFTDAISLGLWMKGRINEK